MKVSFVVPAYNEEAVIERNLKAIERERASVSVETEVVVVNNASTDRTKEVAEGLGVRVVDETKKGLVQARHAGYVATTGELVANIDADTIIPEGWLAKVITAFEQDPALVAFSGPYIYYDLPWYDGVLVKIFYFFGWLTYLVNHYVLRVGGMLQGGNFVVKRSAWDSVGGFDTRIKFYGEDTDVARRIAKVGKVKWTWSLYAYTSGRRLREEGLFRMGWRYAMNFLSMTFLKRAYTHDYIDIRPN